MRIVMLIGSIALFFYLLAWVSAFFKWMRSHRMIKLIECFQDICAPFWELGKLSISYFSLAVIIGIVNVMGIFFFSLSEPNAFYEKANYVNSFEAFITQGDVFPIPAIVEIEKGKDYGYAVKNIKLPYNKIIYPDCDSHEDINDITFSTGYDRGDTWDLLLIKPADEHSQKRLSVVTPARDGAIVASISGSKYHYRGCQYIQNINEENSITFDGGRQAGLFEYEPCDICCH